VPKAPPRLDPDDPVEGFALDMRSLRLRADNPSLAELARVMSCSHSTVSAYLNGRRLPPPDQLKTFVVACKGDLATWQRKLADVHDRLSRLPGSDAPGSTAVEYRPDAHEQDRSSWGQREPDRNEPVCDGPYQQEPLEKLAGTVFDLTDLTGSGISPDEAEARFRRTIEDAGLGSRITTVRPRTFDEAGALGEQFRKGRPLIVDLTETAHGDAERLVDYLAGLAFGLHGTIDHLSSKVFVLYPPSVGIQAQDKAIADTGCQKAELTEAARRRPRLSWAPGPHKPLTAIKVVGIGGGGVNAVNRMIEQELKGVQFIAIDTDEQTLLTSDADIKLEIGRELTRGQGAGANPDVGAKAAEDHRQQIEEVLKGADMVFVTAGEGGGTGTGGAPVVADAARAMGVLAIGVVTRPFGFEGQHRASQAEQGIERLRGKVDTLIVVPNERLLSISDRHVSLLDAFMAADHVLLAGIQGITDLLIRPGLINFGFSAVKSVLSGAGWGLMGIGSARGDDRAVAAAEMAISSPLLEASIDGARGVLLSIQGGSDLGLFEINEAAQLVCNSAAPEANIIFGALIDDTLGDTVLVIVIAAGFAEV